MPKNCTFLAPKKLNEEVRNFADFKSKPNNPGREIRERTLYNIEQQLARVSTILTLQLNNTLEEVDKGVQVNVKEMAKSSLDAISMIGHSQMLLEDLRKDNVKPMLAPEVRSICQHGKYYGDSDYLFGDKYGDLVKDTKDHYKNLQSSVKASENPSKNHTKKGNDTKTASSSKNGSSSSPFLSKGMKRERPSQPYQKKNKKKK